MLTASDLMDKAFLSVPSDLPVDRLASLLAERGATGAVVTDADGGLLGVVTEGDLIAKEQNVHLPTVVTLFGSVVYLESSSHLKEELRKLAASKVADICTREPLTLVPGTLLPDIASLMSERGAHFLPVLDGVKVVGVVSRREIIRALARPG